MYCDRCGTTVSEGAEFCRGCGAKVMSGKTAQQPETEYDLPEKVISTQPQVSTTTSRSDMSAEEFVFGVGGSRVLGRVHSGGVIKLTSKRLIHELKGGKDPLEIDIHDIIGYQSAYLATYNYWLFLLFTPLLFLKRTYDNAIIIYTRQGLSYKFVVHKAWREQLLSSLETLIPSAQQHYHETKAEAKAYCYPEGHPLFLKAKKAERPINIGWIVFMCLVLLQGIARVMLERPAISDAFAQSGTTVASTTASTTAPPATAPTTAVPTTNSAKLTMKDAYDAIILDYGFTPGDAGEFPEDYYIVDIIGDFAPELVIGGDTTRNGRLTGAIYGYDATVGEAFQYRGVTEIHNAEKGKGEYCIDWNWSYLGDYYTVYAPLEQSINEVKFFTVDHENGQYLIDDKVVSQTDFLADISKYLDPDEYDTELIYDEPEPSYGGAEVIMTADELTNLNIFISNFIEAYFTEYDTVYTSERELIHFAYMHNWINYWERMEYAEGGGISYEGIDGSYITTIIKRFFNRDVSLYSFDSYIYQNGWLYSPAADGEAFSNFAQVYRVERDSSGAYVAYFEECQPVEVQDSPSSEMYAPSYTWSGAVYDAVATTGRGGYAIVRPVTLNGRATYQLEYLYTETW